MYVYAAACASRRENERASERTELKLNSLWLWHDKESRAPRRSESKRSSRRLQGIMEVALNLLRENFRLCSCFYSSYPRYRKCKVNRRELTLEWFIGDLNYCFRDFNDRLRRENSSKLLPGIAFEVFFKCWLWEWFVSFWNTHNVFKYLENIIESDIFFNHYMVTKWLFLLSLHNL